MGCPYAERCLGYKSKLVSYCCWGSSKQACACCSLAAWPLTALAWLQSLGGHGPPGCNPAMPEGWHLPLSCLAMTYNVNLNFLAPVPKFSVPTTAPSVCHKSCSNDSLSLGSHQSSADTRHTAVSSPNSSSCKFVRFLLSLLLLSNSGGLRSQPLSPLQISLQRLISYIGNSLPCEGY